MEIHANQKPCTKVYGVEMHRGTNVIEERFSSPNIRHTASVHYKMLCKVNSVICDSLRIVWRENLKCEKDKEMWSHTVSNNGMNI